MYPFRSRIVALLSLRFLVLLPIEVIFFIYWVIRKYANRSSVDLKIRFFFLLFVELVFEICRAIRGLHWVGFVGKRELRVDEMSIIHCGTFCLAAEKVM